MTRKSAFFCDSPTPQGRFIVPRRPSAHAAVSRTLKGGAAPDALRNLAVILALRIDAAPAVCTECGADVGQTGRSAASDRDLAGLVKELRATLAEIRAVDSGSADSDLDRLLRELSTPVGDTARP